MNNERIVLKTIVFYIITVIMTLILVALQLVLKVSMDDVAFVQLGPGIAAVLMLLFFQRRNVTAILKRRFSFNLRHNWVSLIIIVFPFVCIPLAVLIIGDSISLNEILGNFTLGILLWPLIGGLGEELGWRGYLLPLLHKKVNLFIATLITGILWCFWHVPMLVHGPAFIGVFLIQIFAYSVLLSYAYYKADQSVIPAYLYHALSNMVWYVVVMKYDFALPIMISVTGLFLIPAVIIILCNRTMFFSAPQGENNEQYNTVEEAV